MTDYAFDPGVRSELLESRDPAELAASARDMADFISGHAAAIREYERRIEELEGELEKSRTTAAETKSQLAAVLQLVDVLKPSAP